uniref:F-box domain-containing protein n=1 Tax=Culex tarsalis TaxID=7177 RepID=A0A1Q3F4Z1_CULTA
MEVDQVKETGSGSLAWSLDHLPNEILLKIFSSFNFWELIFYTKISPRWNKLCFYLVRDRVALELQPEMLVPPQEWTQNRRYRNVRFENALLPDFDSSCLQPLAEHVQRLKLTFLEADDGPLVEFLRPFVKLESLELKMGKMHPRKSRPRFLKACSGILPALRQLTIRCCYMKLMGLLAEVAPRLVSLDLELLIRLLPLFFECQFNALESLTLRLNMTGSNGKTITDTFPKEKLVQFLSQMKHVRKFAIFVEFFHPAFDVAAALTAIEELTLGGNFWVLPIKTIFKCLDQLPQLRTLNIAVDSFHWLELEKPLPHVTTLNITGSVRIHLPTLARTFPNLRSLAVILRDISTAAELNFALSAWENSMEELSMQISLEFVQKLIVLFSTLRKIRKIIFDFEDDYMDDIAFLSAIGGQDTLQELHIRRVRGSAWRDTVPELFDRWTSSCAVFVNGMRVGRS